MYYAILQKWQGEKTDNLLLEFDYDKKGECERTLDVLRKTAYTNKTPVEYRMIELDGEMQYEGKELHDWRKRNKVERIMIQQGEIYEDIPTYVQKDIKGELK